MIKSKLIKIDNSKSSTFSEKEMKVKVGDLFEGYFEDWPKVEQSFVFYKLPVRLTNQLMTSRVVEIIDDRTFRTMNSIYKIVTVEDERDEKIKIILE
jgi:hypothetical protein